jgi:hypothetical protein
MSNYIKTTNFAAKDALPSGNPAKVAKGTDVDTEFNNIATAISTKIDTSSLGVAAGVASLDASARVAKANLPTDTAYTTASQSWSLGQTFLAQVSFTPPANTYGISLAAPSTAGQSFGLIISAGTNSSDYGLVVRNQSASTNYLLVRGDGTVGISTSTNINSTGISSNNGTFSGTVTAANFSGSGASLSSVPAGQLVGAVPASVLGTGSGTSKWLYWNGGSPAWVQPSFGDLLSTILSGQVPLAVVSQHQANLATRNIFGKTGINKTLQSGGSASGGADGDIIYIY